jgi:hypothetical protein
MSNRVEEEKKRIYFSIKTIDDVCVIRYSDMIDQSIRAIIYLIQMILFSIEYP